MAECPHSLSELFDFALNSSDIVRTFQELSINVKVKYVRYCLKLFVGEDSYEIPEKIKPCFVSGTRKNAITHAHSSTHESLVVFIVYVPKG